MLILTLALPVLAGFGALIHHFYERERAQLLHDAEQTARALMLAVDRDLASAETALHALAASPSLASGDFASFHAQALATLRPGFPGVSFVLTDANAVPLTDTALPYGRQLPADADLDQIRRVLETGEAALSSTLTRRGVVSLAIPVRRAKRVAYALAVKLRPERFLRTLDSQEAMGGRILLLIDSNGTIVARTMNPRLAVGTQTAPGLAAQIRASRIGLADWISREGIALTGVFERSDRTGWTVVMGIPRESIARDILASLTGISVAIAALLAITLAATWRVGGSIGGAIRALTAPAKQLGLDQPPRFPRAHFREADELSTALRQADGELRAYRGHMEQMVAERTRELRTSKALLETVYATAPVGLGFVDPQLRFVMINEYLARLNGLPVADHIGHTLPELVGAAGAELERGYRDVVATGLAIIGLETTGAVPAVPHIERNWLVSYYPVFDERQVLIGVTVVVLDITGQKRMERRLRDNEEQFRALYEYSGDAHMVVTPEAGFIDGNRAAARIFGCATMEQFLRLSPAATSPAFQPDGQRSDLKAQQCMRHALEHGSCDFEWLHQRIDGSQFHADILLTGMTIGGRRVIQATVRDITERKRTEAALRDSRQLLKSIVENIPAMIFVKRAADLRFEMFNRAGEVLLGMPREALLGKSDHDLFPAEQADRFVHADGQVLASGEVSETPEEAITTSAGEVRYLTTRKVALRDAGGTATHLLGISIDITERKRTEQALRATTLRLEEASSAKTIFVANMSHEIRTPMNAIIGLARLLEEAPLPRRERGYVAKIKMSTQSLLGILNNVLDFSRIEAGQMQLEHTPFALEQVWNSIAVLLSPLAWGKGVEPVFAIAPDVPPQVTGDPMRLQQVLLNLVGNAIKFTPQGEVLLRVSRRAADEHGVTLAFAVRDTGIGILPAQKDHIFDAFSQGDSSTSRQYGGAGLGLAISRRLVGLMGGELLVDSEPGSGSEFSFSVRFGHAGGDAVPAPALADGMRGMRVLVVDDNASVRAALVATGHGLGWRVTSAASAAAALDLLRAQGAEPYQLVLLDSAMPGVDGVTMLTLAEAEPGLTLPPVVLLVADQSGDSLANVVEDLQIRAVLGKPVTPLALLEAVATVRGHAGETAPHPASTLAGRLDGIRMLLVEDNEINQEVASYLLLHAGATIEIAANGRLAVDKLAAAPTGFDAVLMDIQMPVMDGYEAAEAIRRMGLAKLPIIAMTANALEEDRRLAFEAGMNEHVSKPIDIDCLVTTLLRLTGRDAGAAAPSTAALPHELAHALPGIDLEAVLPRFGGDFDAFAALLGRFEGSHGKTIGAIHECLQAGDAKSAGQLSHGLRGVAANLGATAVADAGKELEAALRAGRTDGIDELLKRLGDALLDVFDVARNLPPSTHAKSTQAQPILLHAALAKLLGLLQNNNMRAIAEFETIRPALEPALAPEIARALADAVATLGFAAAATLVQDIMTRKDSA